MAPSTPSVPSHSQISGARKKRFPSPGGDGDSVFHQRDTKSSETASLDLQCVSPDRASAPTSDCEASKNRGPARLPALPFELLYSIASELRRSKTIFDFALVNQHLNGVAQQALVKESLIPQNRIRQFLEMLIKHQDLIKSVKAIDLGDYDCGHRMRCVCLGRPNFQPDELKFLGKAIAANTENSVHWSEIRKYRTISGQIWRRNHAFFLNVLLLLCPNITSIALELPAARWFDSSHPPAPTNVTPSELPALNEELPPVTPFHGPALGVMQKNLEVLIVKEDSKWKGPAKREVLFTPQDVCWRNMGKYTITLPGFVKLKHLDVPMVRIPCKHCF